MVTKAERVIPEAVVYRLTIELTQKQAEDVLGMIQKYVGGLPYETTRGVFSELPDSIGTQLERLGVRPSDRFTDGSRAFTFTS